MKFTVNCARLGYRS